MPLSRQRWAMLASAGSSGARGWDMGAPRVRVDRPSLDRTADQHVMYQMVQLWTRAFPGSFSTASAGRSEPPLLRRTPARCAALAHRARHRARLGEVPGCRGADAAAAT